MTHLPDNSRQFKLIVFNLEKPDNIGMLMRSAYALGCQELLVVGKPKIKVTGAQGTQQVLKRRHVTSLSLAIECCREEGFSVIGLEIGGHSLPGFPFPQKVAFLLGNEGRGLGPSRQHCDVVLTIPQWGGVPSLNAAVAGSIAMYEFQRESTIPPAETRGEKYIDTFFNPDVDSKRNGGC